MLSMKPTFELLKKSRALKMLRTKTALGVDISDKWINLALLKKSRNGVKLLASASAPTPDGAIINGNIENIEVLANAIKTLKNHSRIRTTRAAVSLFTEPTVVQIMGIPKQVPSNIGQFVQDQVKHFAILPANNIALDFCGVTGAGLEAVSASRLLVVAADSRKVDEIVKMCSQAGLTAEAIEPPLLAYTRALYDKKIAGKFDSNVLIAILQKNNLTVCVFRRQIIDFVRTMSISKAPATSYGEKAQSNELCQWLAEQINTVVQFYDVDVPNNNGKWEITVVAEDELVEPLPQNAEEVLKAKVASDNLQLLTGENIFQAVVSQPKEAADFQQTYKPSPVAIGLAMTLLDTDARNFGVNLLPSEVVRLRATQKGSLVTANIIAAVLLIMILAVIWPTWKIKKLNESIDYKKAHLSQNTQTLVKERAFVNKQTDAASNKLNQINEILSSHRDIDWPGLLSDIGKVIPRTVCITSLSSGAGQKISLKGLALSNEAVYWFVDRLNNKSKNISSASIVETTRDKKGLINYEISCTIAQGKGKE
jgi:Tfp pilus assembly PilM family ATPase/Tfp pilus assembly protein PilN